MFTGIVESVGRVVDVTPVAGGHRLRLAGAVARELALGDSLAVSGVCLTVTQIDGEEIHADIGPETARITTLGGLHRGDPVNLERSMRADNRFGGHFVQGHVDAVGQVEDVRVEGESRWVTIGFPVRMAPFLIRKGSVAVDGISLTVAGLGEKQFDVQVIPYTWQHTTFAALRTGTRVNLEFDMLGKYVARALELAGPGRMPKVEE